MTHCPSCGRYVGPFDACPHCGAALHGRTPIRVLKVAALILSLGGLGLLWYLASFSEVPTLEIGTANTLTNLAYIGVQGIIDRPPLYDPETGFFSFWLRDETGEMRVVVYDNETEALLNQRRTPAFGDRVKVQGTLRVRQDYVSLTLHAPEKVEIQRDEPLVASLGEISARDAYKRVRVQGQVRSVRAPYSGLTLVKLRDESGEIELSITEVVTAVSGKLPAITVGQGLEVVASVSLYKEQPQLTLGDAADVRVLATPPAQAAELPIAQIDGNEIGHWVAIKGQITAVAPFSAGVKYALDDGTSEITLLVWQEVRDQLGYAEALAEGAKLRVQGEVAEYRGEMEILPELPLDIELLDRAPAETDAGPRITEMGVLAGERIGEWVTVRGLVQETESFANGFKFRLDDGTGQITLLAWHEVYDACKEAHSLNIGATVQVAGKIDLFEGELQIVPGHGDDIEVEKAGTLSAPEQVIASIAERTGQRVTISGVVVRHALTEQGVRLQVGDQTGQVVVFIWQNVWERVPSNQDLIRPGAQGAFTGRVQEYQGELELVPALPYDVRIVE